MSDLAQLLDKVIHKVIIKAENQLELLLGDCQSEVKMTNTQEHILMLLSEDDRLTNSDLARSLKVSQAAVTKAVKSLISSGMLESQKDEQDGRVSYFTLTDQALPIAHEHKHHHDHTLGAYERLVAQFNAEEQALIERFLLGLSQELDGEA